MHPFNRTMEWKLGTIALQVGVDTGWTLNYYVVILLIIKEWIGSRLVQHAHRQQRVAPALGDPAEIANNKKQHSILIQKKYET